MDNVWQNKGVERELTHKHAVFQQVKVKKREVNEYIDFMMSMNETAARKKLVNSQWRYEADPGVGLFNPNGSSSYINDWFGRPGNGAPNHYGSSPSQASRRQRSDSSSSNYNYYQMGQSVTAGAPTTQQRESINDLLRPGLSQSNPNMSSDMSLLPSYKPSFASNNTNVLGQYLKTTRPRQRSTHLNNFEA
jgi:hypothetical protein